jgi:hypothetical protein
MEIVHGPNSGRYATSHGLPSIVSVTARFSRVNDVKTRNAFFGPRENRDLWTEPRTETRDLTDCLDLEIGSPQSLDGADSSKAL